MNIGGSSTLDAVDDINDRIFTVYTLNVHSSMTKSVQKP